MDNRKQICSSSQAFDHHQNGHLPSSYIYTLRQNWFVRFLLPIFRLKCYISDQILVNSNLSLTITVEGVVPLSFDCLMVHEVTDKHLLVSLSNVQAQVFWVENLEVRIFKDPSL